MSSLKASTCDEVTPRPRYDVGELFVKIQLSSNCDQSRKKQQHLLAWQIALGLLAVVVVVAAAIGITIHLRTKRKKLKKRLKEAGDEYIKTVDYKQM